MECKTYITDLPSVSEISESPNDICPVDWAKSAIYIAVRESCGKHVVCRDGMKQLYTIVSDITESRATTNDIELLKVLCETIMEYEECQLSSDVASLVLASIDNNYDEWSKHILRKRCTALVCKKYYTVHIDATKCQGNGSCISACSSSAIAGGDGLISVIDNEKCTRCGDCYQVCTHGAILKAGAIKPKGPESPVPVGSFSDGGGGGEGGRRRRRRG